MNVATMLSRLRHLQAPNSRPRALHRPYLTNQGRCALLEQRLIFEATVLLDDSTLHPQREKWLILHMKGCLFAMQSG